MIFDINLWFPVSLFSLLRWFAVLLLYLFPAHFFFLGSLPFCRCCFHTTQYLFILCTYTLNTNFNFSIYTDTIVSVCVLFTRNIHRVFPRNTCVWSVCVCLATPMLFQFSEIFRHAKMSVYIAFEWARKRIANPSYICIQSEFSLFPTSYFIFLLHRLFIRSFLRLVHLPVAHTLYLFRYILCVHAGAQCCCLIHLKFNFTCVCTCECSKIAEKSVEFVCSSSSSFYRLCNWLMWM